MTTTKPKKPLKSASAVAEVKAKPDPLRHLHNENRLNESKAVITSEQLAKAHAEAPFADRWRSAAWMESHFGLTTNEMYALHERFGLRFIQMTRESNRCVSLPSLVYILDNVEQLCQPTRHKNDSDMWRAAKADAYEEVKAEFKKQFEAEFEAKLEGASK